MASKKVKTVRVNLLEKPYVVPLGAFVKNAAITAGWVGQNQRVEPVKNIISMINSYVGGAILAVASDGSVYRALRTNGLSLIKLASDGYMFGFVLDLEDNGKKKALAISGPSYTEYSSGTLVHDKFNGQYMTRGAIINGRLFGVDFVNQFVLKWSGKNGWNDWTEGTTDSGRFVFDSARGFIKDVFEMHGDIVLVFEFGVARVSVGGNPETFKVIDKQNLPYYYPFTAVAAENYVYFMTEDGLLRYGDNRVNRVEGLISDDATEATSGFLWMGRYYFLCARSRSLKRNIMYVYDILSESYQMIDIPAYFAYYDLDSVIAYTTTTMYRVRNAYSGWRYGVLSQNVNFGTTGRKLATYLEVDCDSDVSVSIDNGRYTRTFSNPPKKLRVDMRGEKFTVKFEGSTGSVRSAYLTAEVPA